MRSCPTNERDRTRWPLGWALLITFCSLTAGATAETLPGAYFRVMEKSVAKVQERLDREPSADLRSLEARPGWLHFPYAILAPAVLYAKKHPQNTRYHDPQVRAQAIRIGDLLARASEDGTFEPRLDSDWDTYMWLEAYRLLESELGVERAARWKREIARNIAALEGKARVRLDYPWYNTPYIGTSSNHYALWAANLYLGGLWFGNRAWEDLGARILHRFVTEEQSEDGYWGEHSRGGPTIGYNHLTLSAVALYGEYSDDPATLPALRRATDFHERFTFLDGTPADAINDRNRYWSVCPWGHFGFSRFPDGRRYAEFLSASLQEEDLPATVGRLAQDALYYHEGPAAPIPQDQERGFWQLHVPAGMRKSGPWQVCLSGIVDTPDVLNQFYLDRQGSVSVFHRTLGLIITGANSKRQPELATFSERVLEETVHMPLSSRLRMTEEGDRLSLAYNTFFADLYVPEPSANEVRLRFVITGKGEPTSEPRLTLQLRLKPGEVLETGSGQKLLVGAEGIDLDAAAVSGLIRHHGWTLRTDSAVRLVWPVYPHNPYADARETSLGSAVAALTIPLALKPQAGLRPREQEITFNLSVP